MMKNPTKTFYSGLAATAIGLSLATMPSAEAQVVIEAGPGEVQISDQDGVPEAVTPGPDVVPNPNPVTQPLLQTETRVLDTMPTPAGSAVVSSSPNAAPDALNSTAVSVSGSTPVTPTQIRTDAGITATAAPQMVPDAPQALPEAPSVAEIAAGSTTPPPTEMSPTVMKRIGALKEELNIADSATETKILLETGDLFKDDTELVDTIAEPRLMSIAEYVSLSDYTTAEITYHYVASEMEKTMARERSVSLVNWMAAKGGLSEVEMSVLDPMVVTDPTPTEVPTDGVSTELQSSVEITLR